MALNCDPQTLEEGAKCINSCLPKGMQMPALIYALCQIANAGGGGGGSGTVTSFSAGNLSPLFTTSVATATTTPALTFALSTQVANAVFAGPATGADAAPTFRALVAADLPSLSAVYVPVGRTITIAGTANQVVSSAGAQDLSANRTWTLSLPQSIATASTPQFARLGLGVAADASLALSCLKASSGAGAAVAIAQFNVTTSDPYIVMGTTSANDGGILQFLRGGGGTFKFGVAGGTGDFRVDAAANCSCNGTFDASGGFKVAGTAGVDGSFDATNTVTVTKGLVTNIA